MYTQKGKKYIYLVIQANEFIQREYRCLETGFNAKSQKYYWVFDYILCLTLSLFSFISPFILFISFACLVVLLYFHIHIHRFVKLLDGNKLQVIQGWHRSEKSRMLTNIIIQ